MTINEESFKAWEQDHIEFLTSKEMGEWLHRRDINARRAEKPTGKWIPVSERLPEYTGLYLISVDDVVTVANFTGTYFMHRGGGRVEVYAWQPLPEPYKKGAEE